MTLKRPLLCALVAVCTAAFCAPGALADRKSDEQLKRHPAYVEDPGFINFATGDTRIVEVTVKGALLRSVARIAAQVTDDEFDEEFFDFLSNLLAVNALILENWEGDEDDVDDLMAEFIEDLDEGWERIVRIQDPNENLRVYVHSEGDEEINGLLVLMHGSNQVVFANIVGPIDLEYVASMSGHFEIPGLERVPRERPDRSDRQENGGRS